MSDNPKITVITVTYNAEKYLRQTIESVINQTYGNIEYIIIDGGSTDGTADIIREYEEHISYWISEPDDGIYDAMNKGIEAASGDWINFMNAGDSFYNQNVLENINFISTEYDLIAGRELIKQENGSFVEFEMLGLDFVNKGNFCRHQALFIRSSLMKKYKYDTQFRIGADYDFMLKCYMNGYKFKFIDEIVDVFIDGGVSASDSTTGSIEALYIQNKYFGSIELDGNQFYNSLLSENPNSRIMFAQSFSRLFNHVLSLQCYQKIVLYGNGTVSQMIQKLMPDNILTYVDLNDPKHPPEKLRNITFDKVVITVLGREREIIDYLKKEIMISADDILCLEF